MITDIARDAIVALGLVPADDVMIAGNRTQDWHGCPLILIETEPTRTENLTQFGPINAATLLAIHCIAMDRQKTWDIVRQAAHAVYAKFEDLEKEPKSGILCITLGEHNVFQVPDRPEFQASVSFNVLHQPTL
jgi:hypothetical protein